MGAILLHNALIHHPVDTRRTHAKHGKNTQVWECPAALGDSRRSSQKYEFGDHESEVKAVDLSADRTKVVSGSKDGNVPRWRPNGGAPHGLTGR